MLSTRYMFQGQPRNEQLYHDRVYKYKSLPPALTTPNENTSHLGPTSPERNSGAT